MKSKLGIGAAAFLFLITSVSAQTNYMPAGSYAPASAPVTTPTTQEAMERYAAWMRANTQPAPAAPVAPTYMIPNYAAPAAPAPYTMPASVPVSTPTANTTPSGNVTAKDITADKIEVKGELKAGVGHFGKDSVYVGSDPTSPYKNYIKVTGSSLANNFLRIMFGTTAANAVERIRILANGFIGIGTTNPGINLHIVDTSGVGNAGMRFDAKSAIASMQVIDNGNYGTELVVNSDTSGSKGSKITFLTSDTNRLSHETVINQNGNVGIGTINPAGNLHIVNNNSDITRLILDQKNSGAGISVLDGPTGSELAIVAGSSNAGALSGINPPSRITFQTQNTEKGTRMVIDKNGNVGIGTTSPDAKLHIVNASPEKAIVISDSLVKTSIGNRDVNTVISSWQQGSNDLMGGITFETKSSTQFLQPMHILNDGKVLVNSEFCLPDGVQPGKSVCFKYACPAANGQWTLSQAACAAPIEPGVVSANINSSFSSPTYVAGTNSVRLASFVIAETTGNEDLQVASLRFDKDMNSNFDIQNLRAKVGSQQIGSAQAIVADGEVSIEFIGGAPLPIVPKNGSIIVDLYGDILSSTTVGTHISAFDLIGGMARGASSGIMMDLPSPVNGQSVVIGAGATLSLTTSANSPSSRYLVMGSSDNVLYGLNLAASNTEDVRVTGIAFRDVIANNAVGIASFNNLRLYDDSGTLLAGPVNMTTTGSTGGDIVFSLGSASSLIIPKNSSKMITLKGDVATFVSGGAQSGSSHVFGVSSPFNVTAYGKDSSVVANVTGTPSGSAQTVYRTKPMLTSSVVGATTGRTRVAVDEIASMVWSANAADDLTISRVGIRLVGQAVTSGTTPFYVSLIDANTNTVWGNSVSQTCTPVAGSQCSVTFNPQFSITRGTNKTVKLRVNSSGFFNNANTSDSLSAVIAASMDIFWSDGTTNNIGFEPVLMPITLANVNYQ